MFVVSPEIIWSKTFGRLWLPAVDLPTSEKGADRVDGVDPESWLPSNEYLPHLDGIRAIALIGVVLFHFKVPGFQGGYAGVDSFLVLSGFLMTRILVRSIFSGKFSLLSFSLRRFWRLYPALLVTVLASMAASYAFFVPIEALPACRSALAALSFVSNYYFGSQVGGYFSTQASIKPLLHTWSLSLEEQFYLVWPLSLWASATAFGRDRRILVALIVVFGGLSLFLSEAIAPVRRSEAFYWLPPRMYEFLLGGLGVCVESIGIIRPIREALALCGLLTLVHEFYFLSGTSVFPGIDSLPTIVATLFLIIGKDTRVSSALSLVIPRTIGKFSYAAYLTHWPIYVFVSKLHILAGEKHSSTPDVAFLIALTAVFAIALNYFIEVPFRCSQIKPWKTILALLLGAISISCAGLLSNGWQWRLPSSSINLRFRHSPIISKRSADKQILINSIVLSKDIQSLDVLGGGQNFGIVVGDSFAAHLLYALETLARTEDVSFSLLTDSRCPLQFEPYWNLSASIRRNHEKQIRKPWPRPRTGPKFFSKCRSVNFARWSYMKSVKPGTSIFLASPFVRPYETVETITQSADELKRLGLRPIVVGPPPGPNSGNYVTGKCARALQLPAQRMITRLFSKGKCASAMSKMYEVPRTRLLAAHKKILPLKSTNVEVMDLFDSFCPGGYNKGCLTVLDGIPLYRTDAFHLSPAGARVICGQMLRTLLGRNNIEQHTAS